MALYDDIVAIGKAYGGTTSGPGQVESAINAATAEAQKAGRPITGYRPYVLKSTGVGRASPRDRTYQIPVFGKTEEETYGPLRAEQQRLAGIQQKLFESQQSDIAEQLKILKGEKSAISQIQQQYSDALLKEAEAKKKAQEQAKQDMQTARANAAMANRSGILQIRPADRAPRTGGTQPFKRRAQQFGTAYKGLSKIQSGMVKP